MRRSLYILGLLVALHAGALFCQNAAAPPARQFVNGRWFTGSTFKPATFYSVQGVLTKKKPAGKIETVDLQGGYVVPAFADAHSHFPDSDATLAWTNGASLAAGVFYILNPNDIAEKSNLIRGRLGKPTSMDVVFAHGGFTCPGGHPKALYEYLVDQKIYTYAKPELEGRAFYSVESVADVEKKWPAFLATQPDFVKLYLLYSEAYSEAHPEHPSQGLRPELVPELTRRAHAAGLRAGAHVESAEDFHNAVAGGVDMVMHLPGYNWRSGDTEQTYLISEADAKLARKRHVIVVTTVGQADYHQKDPKLLAEVHATQVKNLRRLKNAGVTLVVGTDGPPGGAPAEVEHLRASGVFTDLELLKMWSEATATAIFPGRKIGRLREGYEANFLVLAKDPLQDLEAVKQIKLKVKAGQTLP